MSTVFLTDPMAELASLKVVLPGGAGLVGQNLVVRLRAAGCRRITVIDKHVANLARLRELAPEVEAVEADLAEAGTWSRAFAQADVVVMLQAQIGGNVWDEFVRNNVTATQRILEAMRTAGTPRLVHVSSSVVESVADDFYTRSKKEQEALVLSSGYACPVLRPSLMFGWFDRKHLGWLSRFMRKVPVFPVPGHGRYMRQPLYVGDFCGVLVRCIEGDVPAGIYNITGQEKVDYIDMIREIRRALGLRRPILRIPYGLFYGLLAVWGTFDRKPPFTTQQLRALVANDEFEVIDWPGIFGVARTPFRNAIEETFCHPVYSRMEMEF